MSRNKTANKSNIDAWLPFIFLAAFTIASLLLTLVSYLKAAPTEVQLFFAVTSLILLVLAVACLLLLLNNPDLKTADAYRNPYDRSGWASIRSRTEEVVSLQGDSSSKLKVVQNSSRPSKKASNTSGPSKKNDSVINL